MNFSIENIGIDTINALKNGSFEAFNEIYEHYVKKLGNYIYHLSKDADLTQDIVQETFLILWNKRHTVNENLALGSFIFTIARNEYLKTYRNKSKERAFLEEIKSSAWEEVHTIDNKKELLGHVRKVIDELSPKCKEAFVASKFENLTYAEISDRMGISKKTVEIHISKAYSILRKRLKKISPIFLFWV